MSTLYDKTCKHFKVESEESHLSSNFTTVESYWDCHLPQLAGLQTHIVSNSFTTLFYNYINPITFFNSESVVL